MSTTNLSLPVREAGAALARVDSIWILATVFLLGFLSAWAVVRLMGLA